MVDDEGWFKARRYLHFDMPISEDVASRIVKNSVNVATNSFFPFIHYLIKSKKVKADPQSGNLLPSTKEREICYASHCDSAIYSYYSHLLDVRYEHRVKRLSLGDTVLAFRALGSSNIEFAKVAFDEIRSRGDCVAVAIDISKFFNNLDHEILKKQWCSVLEVDRLPKDHFAVFKSLTRYSYVERDALYASLGIAKNNPKRGRKRVCSPDEFRDLVRAKGLITTNKEACGIPQGSPISAMLSNIYMLEFDVLLHKHAADSGGFYLRYCDDMLFIGPKGFEDNINGVVRTQIKKLKLDINPTKTEIRYFSFENGKLKADKPLQYLGFIFDGQRVLIRSAALSRFSEKMSKGVRLARLSMRKSNRKKTELGLLEDNLFKKKIYKRYSYLGKQNFLSYGYRAASIFQSTAIRKQLKPLWGRLKKEIDKAPIVKSKKSS